MILNMNTHKNKYLIIIVIFRKPSSRCLEAGQEGPSLVAFTLVQGRPAV